jgi:WD40 repeat protein
MKTVRIFISSPGDVGAEREKVREIFDRLQVEFSGLLEIAPYFWEHEPMRAHTDFQTQIEPPSKFDLFVCLLWARLGSRLHPALHRKPGGGEYASGTEYELLDALEGFRRSNAPQVMIYKRKGDPVIPAKPKEERERILAQYDALESFFTRLTQEDGHFVVGTNSYDGLEQFETKFEGDMRKVLARFVPEGVAGSRIMPKSWTTGSPFRGLRHFDFEHASIFFGRTRGIDEVLAALKQQAAEERAFVLVFGGSGVGKSSLVRAGVLPWLVKPGVIDGVGVWRRAVMRPNEVNEGDLFDALAAALMRAEGLPEIGSDGTTAARLAAMLREKPDGVGMLIKGALSQAAREVQLAEKLEKQPRSLFALAVDQLEELFTVERLASQREGFLRAIDGLARSGYVWVLATLRSDFYPRCEESPLLMDLKRGNGQYHLQPPDEVQLGQMIRLPAAAAGLLFEEDFKTGERLDDLLRDSAVKSPTALPLLEFALEELYEQRDSEQGLLKLDSYRALGGVEGALGKRAEESFQLAGENAQQSFDLVFRQLVTIGAGEGEPAVRRRARKSEVEKSAGSRDLIARLIADRLLVGDRTEEGVLVIGLAHEAMLSSWPRLAKWVENNRQNLSIRAQVAIDVARWLENARNDDYLYPAGLPLEKARKVQSEGFLSEEEQEFVEASSRRVEKTTRLRMRRLKKLAAGFALLALLAVVAGAVAWKKQREAVAARDAARIAQQSALTNLSRSDFFQAVRLLEENDASGALAYLARSVRADHTNKTSIDLICSLLLQRNWPLPIGHPTALDASILTASFSADGGKVVTISYDNTVRVWDAHTGAALTQTVTHQAAPFSAAFSPDGTSILVAYYDFTVRVWDAQSGQPRNAPMPHESGLESALFSSDGRRVVSAAGDKVYIWDSQTAKLLRPPIQADGQAIYAAFSPDGERVVMATWEAARVWDVRTGKPTSEPIPHSGIIKFAGFTPDGRDVITTTWNNEVRIWNWKNGKPLTEPMRHSDYVASLIFSGDGRRILTASKDHTARLWDADTGRPIAEPMRHDAGVLAAVFSRDERSVITAAGDYDRHGSLYSWDVQNGSALPEPMRHQDGVVSVKFSPDGRRVVTASKDNTARVWDVQTGQALTPPLAHEDAVQCAVFSPDGSRILTGSLDKSARLWDAKTGEPLCDLMRHEEGVQSVAFSFDGERVVTASSDKTAQIWNAHSGKAIAAPLRHQDSVTSAAFSPDGRYVATSCADNTARLWEVESGNELVPPMKHDVAMEGGHETGVLTAVFSPSGKQIVTAGKDNTARVWNAQNGQAIGKPMRHDGYVVSANFSSDGERILSAAGEFGKPGAARIWEAKSGHPLIEPMRHEDGVVSAVFNADNRRVVTASYDKTARLWDSETGKELGDPLRHNQLVNWAEFSPDGKQIVTASEDGGVRVWEVFDQDKRFEQFAPDLSESVGGIKLNERGVPEPIDSDHVEKLRANFSDSNRGSIGDQFIKWFLADRSTRPIAPSLTISTPSYVQRRIREGNEISLEDAYRADPGNALVVVSLAAQSEDPDCAIFYCRYAQAHAGNNAEIWSIAAQVLRKHGKTQEALAAIDRALALQPNEISYSKFRALLVSPAAH